LSEAEKLHQNLSGDWFIVYPDDELVNDDQELIYGRVQDSIVSLMGLKLIILSANGVFKQPDSIDLKGKWGITADNVVFIENGGKGFDRFSGRYSGYENGILRLTQSVEVDGEKLGLVWHLTKITGGFAADLFEEDNNAWRKKPDQPESDIQMRKRLSGMLAYHADYFKLINKEASFFLTSRMLLPFKLYQHAMGMKPFDERSYFAKLFFNKQQAQEAWYKLQRTLKKLSSDFPRTKNYVEEYTLFMSAMADEIVKE
jgi:hypothetical protein